MNKLYFLIIVPSGIEIRQVVELVDNEQKLIIVPSGIEMIQTKIETNLNFIL